VRILHTRKQTDRKMTGLKMGISGLAQGRTTHPSTLS
jgi:hypothetical protein